MHKPEQPQIEYYFSILANKKHLKRMRTHYRPPQIIQKTNTVTLDEDEKQLQTLDISDMLKTISHQKKSMNKQRWKQMHNIHQKLNKPQYDYKFFLIVCSQANYRKLDHPGYFKLIKSHIKQYPESFFSCIDKDIPRTLVDGHPNQDGLRNVLYCYAIRNPSLLYCQGMNYIVAFLLMNTFSEEEAFWFLAQVIQDIVMVDYFKNLSTISITVEIFSNVLKYIFPQLAQQMQQVCMDSSIFLVGWFVCLFTKGFINSVSQYLLQKIVLQTREYSIGFVLLKIALGIISTLLIGQLPLQFQKDFNSLKETIQKNAYETSLDEIKKGMDYLEFDYEAYKKIEVFYTKKRNQGYAEALQKELREKKLSLPLCEQKSPVCLHRTQIQKKIGTIQQVLILKPKIPLRQIIQQNYFPSKVQHKTKWFHYDTLQQCPLTYHTHVCKHDKKPCQMGPKVSFKAQNIKYDPQISQDVYGGEQKTLSRHSNIEEIFNQYSSYFVLSDQHHMEPAIQQFDEEQQQKIQLNTIQNSKFISSIGNVFKKAVIGINLLKK